MDQNFHGQQEAEELLVLEDAVQIFFVDKTGACSTFSERATLRIFRLKGGVAAGDIPTFIQVGDWMYPLISGASPVLEAANGAFMFPDAYATEAQGTAVGLVLAESVAPEARAHLRQLLNDLVKLKSEVQLPQAQQLGTVGKALVSGAQRANMGIACAAERAARYIEAQSERQTAKSAPAGGDAKVSPYLKTSVKAAGYATKATAAATGLVADAVGQLTKHTADYLARKIDRPNSTTPAGKTRTTLIDAARGGLIAYGTIYAGLEESSKTLGGAVKTNTVKVVHHKYGGEAGELSGDAMQAAGDAVQTYLNVGALGLKGIAKSTAKQTVTEMLAKQASAHGQPPTAQQGSVPVAVAVPQGSVGGMGVSLLPHAPPAPPQRPSPPSYASAVKGGHQV